MTYLLAFIALFALILVYFRIADHFNIIDKPNERSSHSRITLRGGGVVFYFGVLLWFFWSGFAYLWFFTGLTLIALISFAEDLKANQFLRDILTKLKASKQHRTLQNNIQFFQ